MNIGDRVYYLRLYPGDQWNVRSAFAVSVGPLYMFIVDEHDASMGIVRIPCDMVYRTEEEALGGSR